MRRTHKKRASRVLCRPAMLALERRVLLASAFIDPPAPPAVFIDTNYTPGTNAPIIVNAGGSLQAAIDGASLGDTIIVQAGATFTGSILLKDKTTGSGWITIRSSASDSELPAPGTRITPAHSSLMPKLVATSDVAAVGTPTNTPAHHYRFIGIEITIASNLTSHTSGIVRLGSASETSLAQFPHDIIFDRCYIHGNATANIQNGMRLNSGSTAVIDSYFDQCQATISSFESHCIGGYNGPGPYKLVNNTFSSACIPVIFGGANTTMANMIPSDLEIRNNYFTRPASWRTEHPTWYVKNLFELKNAQRVLFDGNVLENNWPQTGSPADGSAQAGYAILLNTRSQGTGMPWATVSDITMTNNVIRKSNVGLSLYGLEGAGSHRLKIANNLFDDIGINWGGNDRTGMFTQFQTVGDTQFDHNTIINDGDILFANGNEVADLDFTNNIVHHDATSATRPSNPNKGINAPSLTFGNTSLNAKFVQYLVTKNVMVAPSNYGSNYTGMAAGNFFPTPLNTYSSVGFVDLANRNYRLNASTSAYDNAATDGTDIGANFTTLEAAAGGAISFPFTGTSGNDTYYVKRSGDLLLVYNNATGTGTPILSDRYVYYESISFMTGDGDDRIIVDYSGGDPVPVGGGILFRGGPDGGATSAGNDVLQVIGNGGAASFNPTGSVANGGQLVTGDANMSIFGGESVELGNITSLTYTTPKPVDTLFLGWNVAGTSNISGTSSPTSGGAVALVPVYFPSGVALTINAGANDLAGGSNDTLTVSAGTLSTYRFVSGAGNDLMTIDGGILNFASDLGMDATALAVAVSGAAIVNFAATQHLRSLTLGGQAIIPANGSRMLVTKELSITGSGKLNLNDNAMIVDWTGSTQLPAIHGYVATGRNGGGWNGAAGIVTAMSNAIAPRFLTTLGVAEAQNVLNYGAAQTATWQGQTVDKSAVLVRYTFTGDATLDGVIDGDDYFMIDAGYPGATTYHSGNFDYTGGVTADDYFIIDANYNKAQTGPAPIVLSTPAGAELPTSMVQQTPTRKDDLLDALL